MKERILLVFILTIINLYGCSGDETDKKVPKGESSLSKPSPVESKPEVPYPNSPSIQDLQPDMHISGIQSNHASGAISSSEHISGQ